LCGYVDKGVKRTPDERPIVRNEDATKNHVMVGGAAQLNEPHR
jgi:hypothetical protein